jgi:hypothetical protein
MTTSMAAFSGYEGRGPGLEKTGPQFETEIRKEVLPAARQAGSIGT